ncbi:MAG: pectate lyase [Bacteroides sp.]|nr:pectate lyase [Bacteroides sp.]
MKYLTKTSILTGILLACMACTDNLVTEKIYAKGDAGPFPDYGEVVAFPGAEGFGRYATGGRGGEIYHVTNLNDNGEGSLRDAVSKPNRIVVFDVAGIINLESVLVFSSNLTVAGQTAPGDGVVLYGDRVSFSGAKNVICRYLRVRMGRQGPDGKDAAGIASGSNMIFDHLSVTWGCDENFSINGNDAFDITIQNSIIGQGLQNHSCGGLMQTTLQNGITLFRNLYIDNKTRNPKVKGLNQFVNNVVYNWGNGAAYNMSGDSEGESLTDIEDNYFIVGLVNNWQEVRLEDESIILENSVQQPTKPFIGANKLFSTYCKHNYYDFDKNGTLNGAEITEANWEEHTSGIPTF